MELISLKITFYFSSGEKLETDLTVEPRELLENLRRCFTQKSLFLVDDGVIQMVNLDQVDYVEIL